MMDQKVMNKCCTDCKTTKTPLWRGGPNGPKTLCNACGIRYKKKKKGGQERERKRERAENVDLRESLRIKLVALGEEVLLQHSFQHKKNKNPVGEEEEQAAFSLMALSSGYVFA